jgi:death on curing protein
VTAVPSFISKELALRIHARTLREHGGSHGLCDEGGFESALAAATYAFHLTMAHAFVDGNKRIAAAVAEAFLEWSAPQCHQ